MCAPISTGPPECATFRTIRRALEQCEAQANTRGFHDESRLAYVVASLRARAESDCHKAADFLMRIFDRTFP